MIRINKKHLTALLLQPLIYVAVHAAEREQVAGPVMIGQSRITVSSETKKDGKIEDIKIVSTPLKQSEKNKPLNEEDWKITGEIEFSTFLDWGRYGAKDKFQVGLITDEDSNNTKQFNYGVEAALGLEKMIKLKEEPLKIKFGIEVEEKKLTFGEFFVEHKVSGFNMKAGYAYGNFCTYKEKRYKAIQVALSYKLSNDFNIGLAFEEAQDISIKKIDAKENADLRKEVDNLKSRVDKFAPETANNESASSAAALKDKTNRDNFKITNNFPQVATILFAEYKQPWGDIKFSGLFTMMECTHKDEGRSYQYIPMYGAAISTKYLLDKDIEDKDITALSVFIKYRAGLSGYHSEGGGIPEHESKNVYLSANGKKIAGTIDFVDYGLNLKHSWTKEFSSSIGFTMIHVINSNKLLGDSKYDNGLDSTINIATYKFTENLETGISYNIGVRNILSKTAEGLAGLKPASRIDASVCYKF